MSNLKKFFKPQYRVVRDDWAGFECQIKRWWWPFWSQMDSTNTHSSLEDAKAYINEHKNKVLYSE